MLLRRFRKGKKMSVKLESTDQTRERCTVHGAIWYGDRLEYTVPGRVFKSQAVRAVFANHDMDRHLPSEPRPDSQLKRAAREGHNPNGMVSRAATSPIPDTPMAILVYRVDGTDESGDEFSCLARVRIAYRTDPATGTAEAFASALPPQGQTEFGDSEARDRAIWIATRCNELLGGDVHNKDLGLWTRAALKGAGAAQSIGGGNNFYAPEMLCDKLHDFMTDLSSRGMIHGYVRDPKTSLGALHEKAVMADCAQRSLGDEIAKVNTELKGAIEKAAGTRKQTAYLKNQNVKIREIQNRIALYKDILEERLVRPLQEATELYRQHFTTLLDGGTVSWADAKPADEPTESEAPEAPAEAPASDAGEVLAASAPAASGDWWN
jgi:hypothetical protein